MSENILCITSAEYKDPPRSLRFFNKMQNYEFRFY